MTDTFQSRFIEAFDRSGMSVAELSRRSGVSYHAIDKLKKRPGATTSVENARKLAAALGMDNNHGDRANRMITLFMQLSPQSQDIVLKVAQSLLGS